MLNSKTTFNFNDIEYIDSIIEEKYEIIDGQIYMMGGSRGDHAFLKTNFSRLLGNQLAKTPCTPFTDSLKLKIEDNIFRPDIIVMCEKIKRSQTIVESPSLIVEVVSSSTEFLDRNKKLFCYMKIPTLKSYIIVNKKKQMLEVFKNTPERIVFQNLLINDTLVIEDLINIKVSDIYNKMEKAFDAD